MYRTCREELLHTVRMMTKEKGSVEFTVSEAMQRMKVNKTAFADSTIRIHIRSRCCINAKRHHAVTYNDYEHIDKELYKLINQ